jgi:EAL domain-containing protein (putative c-di-GMP-specific phosphodiesterase class I)
VLAEHIESELQLTELRRLGVKYGQGYHLGRPRPAPLLAVQAGAG